jgi:hypothetical protein
VKWNFLLLLLAPLAVSGEVYQCEDADGNTVFSDMACSGLVRARIEIKPSSANSVSAFDPVAALHRLRKEQDREEYERKRASLERQLRGTHEMPGQTLGSTLRNNRRRQQLESAIKLLDRGYLIKTDPTAAAISIKNSRVEVLERKMEALERRGRRSTTYTRLGNTIYGSRGQICTTLGNTMTCR